VQSKITRRVVVLGAMALSASAFAGCSRTNPSGGGGSAQAGGTINITLANHPWSNQVKAAVPEFEKETGIKVDLAIYDDEQLAQLFNVKLNAKSDEIDVLMYRPLQDTLLMNKNGWLADISNRVTSAPAEWQWDDFMPSSRDSATVDGKVVGVPIATETAVLYYRKDLLAEVGMDVPKTTDDLKKAVEAIHAKHPDIFAFAGRGEKSAAVTQFSSFLYGFGGEWVDANGKASVNTPQAIEAFNYYGGLIHDYGPPGASDMNWPQVMGLLQQGLVAFYPEGSSQYNQTVDPEKSKVKDKIGVAPIPAGPAGEKPYNITNFAAGISQFSKNQEAAWKFIEWATSKANVLKFQQNNVPGPRTSVWNDPQLLATAGQELTRSGQFTSLIGALDPNGTVVAPDELARAHQQLTGLGPVSRLPDSVPTGVSLSTSTYDAYKASSQFISADGRTIRFAATLRAGPSTSTAAAQAIPGVRAAVTRTAHQIGATASGVDGYAPVAYDVGAISGGDLMKIIPIVMIVLALLLAIVLRSLIAPLYLVVSVALSYLASLGLAVLVFVLIGGQDGINFVLPFFMFIFIMALGQDYNILVMTRIREEAHHAPIKEAVRRAVEATGTTVTSAGLILAGTFGVLTATGNTQVQEIGLGLAAGILLDTFFVRTLLVPSVVVLLGRWNWWPSALSHEDHSGDGYADGGVTGDSPLPGDLGPVGGCEATEPSARPLAGVGS